MRKVKNRIIGVFGQNYTAIFFWRNLFEMGESAQLNFAPKFFGRNFADLGEFPPNKQIFGWTLDEIRPNRKKFAHKFWGET
jgi:transposase